MRQAPEFFDFSSLSPDAIEQILEQHHLALSADDVLTIQHSLLKRPPTVAECMLWSVKKAERHSQSGVVTVITDGEERQYHMVVNGSSYQGVAGISEATRKVSSAGAEVVALASRFGIGDWRHQAMLLEVSHYSNALGIPHLAYAMSDSTTCNETVSTTAFGIVREDQVISPYAPANAEGYALILVGKPIEKDLASAGTADSLLQQHLLKANDALFNLLRQEKCLNQVGLKSVGWGGIGLASLALLEARGYGAEIDLTNVPTSMVDVSLAEMLCADTQERWLWVVAPSLVDKILIHYNDIFALATVSEGAHATVIGKIRTDDRYVVKAGGEEIVNAKVYDLTSYHHDPVSRKREGGGVTEVSLSTVTSSNELLALLAGENNALRTRILHSFDKQVQGRVLIEMGAADAGVMQPFNDDSFPEDIRQVGVVISLSYCASIPDADTSWSIVRTACESIRKVLAMGATPIALVHDSIHTLPEMAQQDALMTALQGIAGVSLENATVSCIGVLQHIKKLITPYFKRSETVVMLLGEHQEVPQLNLQTFTKEIATLYAAMEQGLVMSARVVSREGVAVTLAEMSFKNNIGVNISAAFNSSNGFILEVARDKAKEIKQLFAQAQLALRQLGETTANGKLRMNGAIDLSIQVAKQTWENGIQQK